MQSHRRILVWLFLSGISCVAFAQASSPSGPVRSVAAVEPNVVSVPSLPYTAEIVGNDVYVRSGAGTNYYNCGKLNKGDKVEVVSTKFTWSQIVPPPGSFSWISMQYVSIDPDNPNTGIVTGDNVRVYAGSDFVRPIHSTTFQGKLNIGDKVKLLGEQKENYYKIAPPSFAYLWVSTQFTKPFVAAKATVPPITSVEPNVPVVEPNVASAVVEPKLSVEAEKLNEYRALEKALSAERAKTPGEQDYTKIKAALTAIANNKEAGKAARYSEFTLRQIERVELVLAVTKQLKLQNDELEKTKARIEKARATRLAAIEDLGKYAVIGELQVSNIYGPEAAMRHYRILDETGKTICYAVGDGGAGSKDLSSLIGKKVGLIGQIEAHFQTAGALVRFTEAAELK